MSGEGKTVLKICLDLFLLLIAVLALFYSSFIAEPVERGFFCDDESIRYHYYKSTISVFVLYSVGFSLPIIVIFITELSRHIGRRKGNRSRASAPPSPMWTIYTRVSIFVFGGVLETLFADVAKNQVGRLRPHFIEICNPDVNCSEVLDPHAYIDNYVCQGPDEIRIIESRLSFPSGHAGFSAYAMVYTVLYLQACMNGRTHKLLKLAIQSVLVMMAWFTSLSRISDFVHHWSDVFAGFLLGSVVAVMVVFLVSDFWYSAEKKPKGTLQTTSVDTQTFMVPDYSLKKCTSQSSN